MQENLAFFALLASEIQSSFSDNLSLADRNLQLGSYRHLALAIRAEKGLSEFYWYD
jgi:hypothetical protein